MAFRDPIHRSRLLASGLGAWLPTFIKLGFSVLIAVVGMWWHSQEAEATGLQVRIYSSLEPSSGLFEYGKHFDESNIAFGARDYNFDGDGNTTDVYLRLNLYQTQTYYMRYHVWPRPGSTCGMYGKLAQYIGGEWLDIGGTELHFLHQTQISETWTNYILSSGETIGWYLGDLNLCGGATQYHSHMSGDVGTTSLMLFYQYTSESCWTDLEYSFQCPTNYPDHNTCSSSLGTASFSGTYSEYVCSTWNKQFRSTSDPTFYVYY